MKFTDALDLSLEPGGAFHRHENDDERIMTNAPFAKDYSLDMSRLRNVVVTGDESRHYALALAAVSLHAHGYDVAYIGGGYETLEGLEWSAHPEEAHQVLREVARRAPIGDRITVVVTDDVEPTAILMSGIPDWSRGVYLIYGDNDERIAPRALKRADRSVDAPFGHSFIVQNDKLSVHQNQLLPDGVRQVRRVASESLLYEASQEEILRVVQTPENNALDFTRACRVRNRQSEPYREPRWTTKLRRFFP